VARMIASAVWSEPVGGREGLSLYLFFFFFFLLFLFFFFFFESYDYCLWVQNPTCSLRYGIEKTPNYPWEKKNQPRKSLWYGTNRTSRPQQETLD